MTSVSSKLMLLAFILLAIPISLLGISTTEASISDLENTKPTNPIDPKTDSPTDQSGKEGTTTNDLSKAEAEPQTRDETDPETNGGNDITTSENKPTLKVRPFINCDLNPGPLCYGTQNADTILGGKYIDNIMGLGGNDWINGSGGPDFVVGYEGNDIIYGDEGNDMLNGAEGSDKILGGEGMDKISGGPGDDIIFQLHDGIQDEDQIDCGEGNDEVRATSPSDVDYIKNCEKTGPIK